MEESIGCQHGLKKLYNHNSECLGMVIIYFFGRIIDGF